MQNLKAGEVILMVTLRTIDGKEVTAAELDPNEFFMPFLLAEINKGQDLGEAIAQMLNKGAKA